MKAGDIYSVNDPLPERNVKWAVFGDLDRYAIVDRVGNVTKIEIPWWLRVRFWLFRKFGRKKQSGLVAYWRSQQ